MIFPLTGFFIFIFLISFIIRKIKIDLQFKKKSERKLIQNKKGIIYKIAPWTLS